MHGGVERNLSGSGEGGGRMHAQLITLTGCQVEGHKFWFFQPVRLAELSGLPGYVRAEFAGLYFTVKTCIWQYDMLE